MKDCLHPNEPYALLSLAFFINFPDTAVLTGRVLTVRNVQPASTKLLQGRHGNEH